MAVNTEDSRVNVLLRLVGVIFIVLGVAMTYETFLQAASDVVQAPLVPVFYLCSGMLVLAGLAAVIAKYKPSGAQKV